MSRIGRAALGMLVTAMGVAAPAGAARADAVVACEVAYAPSSYTGGFTAQLEIRNVGDEDIDGWTFRFPLASTATVVEFYNADLVTATGTVEANDKGWNAAVARGTQISVGFRATGYLTGPPTWFSVNGVVCRRGVWA